MGLLVLRVVMKIRTNHGVKGLAQNQCPINTGSRGTAGQPPTTDSGPSFCVVEAAVQARSHFSDLLHVDGASFLVLTNGARAGCDTPRPGRDQEWVHFARSLSLLLAEQGGVSGLKGGHTRE